MRKSRKRNHIFDVVNTENALQIALKSQSKATMRDGAKAPQIQVPENTSKCHEDSAGGV